MPKYNVVLIETVETHYKVEVNADNETHAKILAEDFVVNYPDVAKENNVTAEKQISILRYVKEV